jgi:predicted thioredoxin/glutaredoxin
MTLRTMRAVVSSALLVSPATLALALNPALDDTLAFMSLATLSTRRRIEGDAIARVSVSHACAAHGYRTVKGRRTQRAESTGAIT